MCIEKQEDLIETQPKTPIKRRASDQPASSFMRNSNKQIRTDAERPLYPVVHLQLAAEGEVNQSIDAGELAVVPNGQSTVENETNQSTDAQVFL